MPVVSTATGHVSLNSNDTDLLVTSAGSITVGGTSTEISVAANGSGSDFYVDNSGLISGSWYGIDFYSGDDAIVNERTGVISAGAGTHFSQHEAIYTDQSSIYNLGTISSVGLGAGPAIEVSHDSTVSNFGTIIGDIKFDSGTNAFSGLGGVVDGSILGGTGNDTFDLSHQIVTGAITGGGGSDTIAFASASGPIAIDLGGGTAVGAGENLTFSGFENATGSGYADTITGDDNANTINAGAGNDTISGNGGADIINAGSGVDTVMGGPGNDVINGNGGNDVLYGNGGADVIAGGAGADTLTGGAGNDTFVYYLMSDSTPTAPDLITDFVHGQDKIDLTALSLDSANDVKITSSGGLTSVFIDSNGDGTVDMQINLTGNNVLTTGDIVGIPTAAAPTHTATATVELAPTSHHDLATSLHAVTVDHALYG